DDPVRAGMFLGTAIHDTAQVTGAALIHGQMFDMSKVVDVATVTKLTRNIFIIVIIPFVSYLYFKERTHPESEKTSDVKTNAPKWYTFIPLFVIGRSEERRVGKECRCRWWRGNRREKRERMKDGGIEE